MTNHEALRIVYGVASRASDTTVSIGVLRQALAIMATLLAEGVQSCPALQVDSKLNRGDADLGRRFREYNEREVT